MYKELKSRGSLATALSVIAFSVTCVVRRRRVVNGRAGTNELSPDLGYFKAVHYFLRTAFACSSGALFANVILVSMVKSRVNGKLNLRWGNVVS